MKINNLNLPLMIILLSLSNFVNCATFAKLGSEDLLVIGPEDSHIFYNQEKIGESVAMKKIGFPSKDPNLKSIVRIEKTGFAPNITELEKETNPWFWGNLLFLGGAPIGFLVDYFADTNKRFTPLAFKAELKENPGFKVDLSNKEIQNYQLLKEKSKDLDILLTFSNLSELSLVKVDDKGNPLKSIDTDFSSVFGKEKKQVTVTPGNYLLKGRYRILLKKQHQFALFILLNRTLKNLKDRYQVTNFLIESQVAVMTYLEYPIYSLLRKKRNDCL
jgi:hypothetical protein